MKKTVFYFLLILAPVLVFGQNTSYKELDSVFYYPGKDTKVPVIFWFHGGGLTGGDKEIPEALKNNKYLIVGVQYRLAPKVKAEESVADATAAVAWVFKNIQKYNGDPDAIFVSGHSVGDYLALMTVMDKNRRLRFGRQYSGRSCSVHGA